MNLPQRWQNSLYQNPKVCACEPHRRCVLLLGTGRVSVINLSIGWISSVHEGRISVLQIRRSESDDIGGECQIWGKVTSGEEEAKVQSGFCSAAL